MPHFATWTGSKASCKWLGISTSWTIRCSNAWLLNVGAVGADLWILRNASLPTCRAEALADTIAAKGELAGDTAIEDNDDTHSLSMTDTQSWAAWRVGPARDSFAS